MDGRGSVGDWLWSWIPKLPTHEILLTLYGLYMIWFCRNEIAHGKNGLDVITAAFTTRNRVTNFSNPVFKLCTINETGSLQWERPEWPFMKINCDGSWFPISKRVGFGCVVTGNSEVIMGVRAGFFDNGKSCIEAEGFALYTAL